MSTTFRIAAEARYGRATAAGPHCQPSFRQARELRGILATRCEVLSPRMVRLIENLAGDWRRLDERIESLSGEIDALARQDAVASG